MQEDETALVSSRDLRCVICYELFEWPITLFCGHTFCRTCISLSWAAQRQAPGHCCYTCPVCRKEYPRKRKLTKTVVLANMVEEVRKRRKAPRSEGCGGAAGGGGGGGGGGGAGDCNGADQGGVSCKSCLGEDALAVKTCLRCESPLCEAHVRRHGLDPAFSDHELAPLSVNTAARRCKEHRATLKYYCTQDGLLVCSDCCLFGTHKDHQLVAARDEYEERKLLVTIEKERRVDRKKSSEAKILELSDYHNRVEKYTDEMKTRVHAFYALNRPLLDDEEEEIMHGLDAQCGPALYMAQHNIQLHQREIHSLGCLIARLDALLDTDDPITFLQDPVLNELTLPTTVDITGEPFPSMDVHQTISLQKIMGTRPLPLIAERYGCSPTLDPATASPWLRVSRDLRTVMGSPPRQPPPDHPARFDCWHPQVLGACPLSSGRHYWEVDVGGAGSWRVGVAYGSIPRKGQGNVCKLGENSQSWCLFMDNGELTARHGGVGTLLRPQTEAAAPAAPAAAPASGLPVGSLVISPAVGAPVASSAGTSSEPPAAQPSTPPSASPPTAQPTGPSSSPLSAVGGNPSGPPPRRVGVLLDCDAGTVGFYRADDSTALLHSFAAKFAQPLYPALAVLVWDGSLTMVELE